jgi:hypothetical protein
VSSSAGVWLGTGVRVNVGALVGVGVLVGVGSASLSFSLPLSVSACWDGVRVGRRVLVGRG